MSAGNNITTYCWLYFLGDLRDSSICSTVGRTYSAPNKEYILLCGTNLCITSKLHHLCIKKVDRNIP